MLWKNHSYPCSIHKNGETPRLFVVDIGTQDSYYLRIMLKRVFSIFAVLLAGIATASLAVDVVASPTGDSSASPNPFAGFETIVLPNGLRVWFKSLPHDPNFAISVSIPYGSDSDPPGLEELAHFTEHMLFSDHMGRTEEEIKAEIEDLGGSRNGYTYTDHTYYYAVVDSKHAMIAIDWLYRIVSPHTMPRDIVERQRIPIILELGARQRGLVDWIQALYIDPPFLRLPGFWKREFGLSTRRNCDYDPYRSLKRITPVDLRRFYNNFYVASRMILTVVGNVDRDAALSKINETFATLPARPAPPPSPFTSRSRAELPNPQLGRPLRCFVFTLVQTIQSHGTPATASPDHRRITTTPLTEKAALRRTESSIRYRGWNTSEAKSCVTLYIRQDQRR